MQIRADTLIVAAAILLGSGVLAKTQSPPAPNWLVASGSGMMIFDASSKTAYHCAVISNTGKGPFVSCYKGASLP